MDVFTTGQVAKICGVSQQAVIKWFDSGRLRGFRVPDSRDRRIPKESLVEFMKAHAIPPEALERATREEGWREELAGLRSEVREQHRKIKELSALLEITNRLYQPFELDSLLQEIIATCRDLMSAEACSVLLVEEGTGNLNFYWVKGGSEKGLKEITLAKGQGIAGWVAETGQSVLVEDAQSDPRFFSGVDKKTNFITKSLVCVPIKIEGAVIGVVELINKKGGGAFTREDEKLLGVLAGQVGLALEKVRRQEKAVEKDRLATIGAMAGAIIHDLKNPMTVIKGFTYLLQRKSFDNTEYCRRISEEIDRMVGMVKDLLFYSKGESSLVLQKVALGGYMTEFLEAVKTDLDERRIRLRTEFLHDGTVVVDREKFRRVLANLVTNAGDAMPDGGEIAISTRKDGDDLVVTIRDTGCGIPASARKNLFKPFFTYGKEHGTGLGLSICRSIVKAHGGTIAVESEVGVGTTFSLRLPVEGPSRQAFPPIEEIAAGVGASAPSHGQGS